MAHEMLHSQSLSREESVQLLILTPTSLRSIPGVAKLLDSPSHFSKFEIFRVPQLNMHLKGIKKLQKLYLLKTYK